ncbi:hypothetical protein SKAU_G00086380 [Synaphobranchus kaupii]|uniref:SEA domain-containing protein n=1 Tax=Synaphobranchus kaupii TaxID=118154 RepID=A0A9Q1J3T8_SYNKA|nr:hypothetical protein SKAU_G00086380 [Synaphobranchus kaupii]
MNGDIELVRFRTETDEPSDNNNSQSEQAVRQQITAGCEDQSFHNKDEATEESHLLSADQSNSNSTQCHSDTTCRMEQLISDTVSSDDETGRKGLCMYLNRKVVWRLRLWMLIALGLLLLAILVLALALILYSVLYVDEDDIFDGKSFVVPLFYSGSLRLVNQNFTEDLLSPTSSQSQALSGLLEQKLSNVYSSSPALGRYFSSAGFYAFRNGSVTAYYWLKFLMPQEHKQLLHYTLSREMVYNVLRQYLYDVEADVDPLHYLDPAAIYMEVGNRTLIND